MSKKYSDGAVGKRDANTNLSLSLIEKGVPFSAAFALQAFFGRGKTNTVNHSKVLRSQLKNLKESGFEGVDVREIRGAEDVVEYLGLPEYSLDRVRSVMDAGKGYSHVARVGGRPYLVRTNPSGHKVMRTKDISGIF